MAMTRSEMRTEVRYNIKRTSDGVADTRINTWLNWAQAQLADWHTYEEMRKKYTGNTEDGEVNYGFPSNMKDIHAMTLQDGASSRKLIYVPAREFESKVPRAEQASEGLSTYYVDYGLNFELYRIPDADYELRLRCSTYPSDMTSDTDYSTLLRKDSLICAVATMFGFLSLRELEDATYWKNEVVAPLYASSLSSDHSAEDWTPVARGFDTRTTSNFGEYHTNPLIKSMP